MRVTVMDVQHEVRQWGSICGPSHKGKGGAGCLGDDATLSLHCFQFLAYVTVLASPEITHICVCVHEDLKV